MSGQISDRGVRRLFVSGAVAAGTPPMGAKEKFDAWLERHDAEVERHAAEKGWDEGEAAGGVNAGDGLAALLGGVDPPEPRANPYRRNEGGTR